MPTDTERAAGSSRLGPLALIAILPIIAIVAFFIFRGGGDDNGALTTASGDDATETTEETSPRAVSYTHLTLPTNREV